MSGLALAVKLKQAGHDDVVLYEKAAEIGGTWRENRYPGVRCDVPSRFYSFTFAPNPGWREVFAPGADIQDYLLDVVEEFGLRAHLRLNSEVVDCRWEDGRWQLTTGDGRTDVGDVLVTATGILHHPLIPHIPGLDTFRGPAVHSARWDDSLDLTGRRVAVIGTGSTGVQMSGAVAERAAYLEVYQRTAQWLYPVPQGSYSRLGRYLWRRFPSLARVSYEFYRRLLEATLGQALVGPGWQRRLVSGIVRAHLRIAVRDPELRRQLTPPDQPMCRRLVMSTSFYKTVQLPHVELVTDGIDEVVEDGIITRDGRHHPMDAILLATGFRTHEYFRPMRLVGEDGRTADDAWRRAPRAYRTVALPGFPNFFMLVGPHSPIGNHSVVAVAETQADYVVQYVDLLARGEVRAAYPSPEVTDRYNAELRDALPRSLWATGCSGWYLDAEGLPDAWPWSAARHRDLLAEVDTADWVPAKTPTRSVTRA